MRTAPSVTVNSRYVMLIMMNGHSALSSLLDPADTFPPASAFAEEEDGAFASSPTGAILSARRGCDATAAGKRNISTVMNS